MKSLKFIAPLAVLLAACAEPEPETTVICWTAGDEEIAFEKYQSTPETICVPIIYAPQLPPSVIARAEIRSDRDSDGRPSGTPAPAPVPSTPAETGEPDEPEASFEVSDISDRGVVAAEIHEDGTEEYSVIDRTAQTETGRPVVRAVEDRTEIRADMAKETVDRIFAETARIASEEGL